MGGRLIGMFLLALAACGGSKKAAKTPPAANQPAPLGEEDKKLCDFAVECKVETENDGQKPADQMAELSEECLGVLGKTAPALRAAIHDCTGSCGDCMGYWECVHMTDPADAPCFSEEEPMDEPEEGAAY